MRLFRPLQLHSNVFLSSSKMAKTTTFWYRTPRSTLRESIWQKLNTFSGITFHALSIETTPVSKLHFESKRFPCKARIVHCVRSAPSLKTYGKDGDKGVRSRRWFPTSFAYEWINTECGSLKNLATILLWTRIYARNCLKSAMFAHRDEIKAQCISSHFTTSLRALF